MGRRHTLSSPIKPFACACGETRPSHFPPMYKSICVACRNAREAARQRAKAAASREAKEPECSSAIA